MTEPPPARRQDSLDAQIPDDPPPAYTPTPEITAGEQSVDQGSSRPAQQSRPSPPRPPPRPTHPPTNLSQSYPSSQAPPSHPSRHRLRSSASSSPRPPPPKYSPTESPTPGQPLLNRGQILVYPTDHLCHKCNNVGYKADDPSNPCRKCWSKYSRPFSSAMKFSIDQSPTVPSNYQKPLPQVPSRPHHIPSSPASRPPQSTSAYPGQGPRPPMQQGPYQGHHPFGMPPGPPPPPGPWGFPGAFPRPGGPPGASPRPFRGQPCYKCGGEGLVPVPVFFLDRQRCSACGGTGYL